MSAIYFSRTPIAMMAFSRLLATFFYFALPLKKLSLAYICDINPRKVMADGVIFHYY